MSTQTAVCVDCIGGLDGEITFCPLHKSATALLEALEWVMNQRQELAEILNGLDYQISPAQANEFSDLTDRADATIKMAKGED